MEKEALTDGVLILAGLADPCGDIGTQYRYDLLPIPLDEIAFKASVARMIKAEKWTVFAEELDPQTHPIGLRCWVCHSPESQTLKLLMADGWTDAQGNKAATLIDRLSSCVPAIEFIWPSKNPDDAKAMKILNKNCYSYIEVAVTTRNQKRSDLHSVVFRPELTATDGPL